MRRLLVILAALCVVAGCSTSVAGTPFPEAAPIVASPGASGLNLPPRPRDLKLDDIDPCTLLTPSQLAELELDKTVPSIPTDPTFFTGMLCTAGGFDSQKVKVTITFATNRGIEAAINGPDTASSEVQKIQIDNFPGATKSRAETNSCTVDIDVAPKQFIDVFYQDESVPPKLSQEQLCMKSMSVGQALITSLLDS